MLDEQEIHELRRDFFIEFSDHMDELEPLVLQMEAAKKIDVNHLRKIKQSLHSLKGIASSCDLNSLTKSAHLLETFLEQKDSTYEKQSVENLLGFIDLFRSFCDGFEDDNLDVAYEQAEQFLQKISEDMA